MIFWHLGHGSFRMHSTWHAIVKRSTEGKRWFKRCCFRRKKGALGTSCRPQDRCFRASIARTFFLDNRTMPKNSPFLDIPSSPSCQPNSIFASLGLVMKHPQQSCWPTSTRDKAIIATNHEGRASRNRGSEHPSEVTCSSGIDLPVSFDWLNKSGALKAQWDVTPYGDHKVGCCWCWACYFFSSHTLVLCMFSEAFQYESWE